VKLSINNLSVVRGRNQVLHNISLDLGKPELIGLIGPNGAGKSTLMKALAGLQKFTGSVDLDGRSLRDYSDIALAQTLAFLPQERTVHWPLACREIVMLGRMPYQSGLGSASEHDQKMVSQAMQIMQVQQFAERPFDKLSGGEQARVLIAEYLLRIRR